MESKPDFAPQDAGKPDGTDLGQGAGGAPAGDWDRFLRAELRVHKKIDDYTDYDFSAEQSEALNAFFDLVQESDVMEDLYSIAVAVPKVFFGVDSSLYTLGGDSRLRLTWSSLPLEMARRGEAAGEELFVASPTRTGGSLLLPIKGNRDILSQLPFSPRGNVIGLLEIRDAGSMEEHDQLFFEKYANRVGFQLHNRIIARKNREHLQFIRNLVRDIGHNVIVPNMYFKLFYRRLETRIKMLWDIIQEMRTCRETCRQTGGPEHEACGRTRTELEYVYEGMREQYGEILRHYEQTSLFLETLLRRSHFEQGRYVLDMRTCNFKSQVLDPQIARYKGRLEERGIGIDTNLGGVPDREIKVVADLGLISQVYANLFSNAVKYTREAVDERGHRHKFIAYGWEPLQDFFGPGRDGLKLNVFSTGPRIAPDDAAHLFDEGFRGRDASAEYGTGHGLSFVREVVELHGGKAGYEPTPMGNNFYFILPLAQDNGTGPAA
jgi:signal transduction histidine kinase